MLGINTVSRMSLLIHYVQKRSICLSAPREGKRSFNKFLIYNKRGSRIFKEKQSKNPDPMIPIDKRGCRDAGLRHNGRFVKIPEMIPEIMVPDLTDCKLKPYVSYRAPDVVQSKFTAEQLFEVVYGQKIRKDFKEGKLDARGNPAEPSPEETLTSEEAFIKARQTGSDIFKPRREEWHIENEERKYKELIEKFSKMQ